ncbi:MAG: hypothetical protein HYW48_10575 [Deltaproteobacteria bacterium]|nr:hypothetical protein [Deltaproteobacteria bacterium]
MALNYRIVKNDQWETIFFSGKINEDAEVSLAELNEKVGDRCIFNLKEIEAINSLGVRAWINFLRNFEQNRQIIFEECPPGIVNQFNMIPSFKGKATIRSLYAGYICENCGLTKMELFKEGENLPRNVGATPLPEVKCSNCGKTMELEELEDEYFGWISTRAS